MSINYDYVSNEDNDQFVLEVMYIMEIDPRYTKKRIAELLSENSLDSKFSLSKAVYITTFKSRIDSRSYKIWRLLYPMILEDINPYKDLTTEDIRKKILQKYEQDPQDALEQLSLKDHYFTRVIQTYKKSKLLDLYDILFDISHQKIKLDHYNAKQNLEKLSALGFSENNIIVYLRKNNLKELSEKDNSRLHSLLTSYEISKKLLSTLTLEEIYSELSMPKGKIRHVREKYNLSDEIEDRILLSLILEDKWKINSKTRARHLSFRI